MDASSVNQIDLKALMFQTGYLTIKGYHALVKQYTLAFPNREVQEAFIDSLVRHFAPHNMPIADACYEALAQHQPAFFFDQIKADVAAFTNDQWKINYGPTTSTSSSLSTSTVSANPSGWRMVRLK